MFEKILLYGIILSVVLFSIDFLGARKKIDYGTIIDKHYTSSETSTGIGVTSKGTTVVTTSSTPRKWEIAIRIKDGSSIVAESENNIYYEKKIGDSIEYSQSMGLITGWTYSYDAVK